MIRLTLTGKMARELYKSYFKTSIVDLWKDLLIVEGTETFNEYDNIGVSLDKEGYFAVKKILEDN